MDLPSETSRSYEIGFKSAWMDNRLRLNGTAYHQTFKNFPFRSPRAVYYVNYTPTLAGGVVTNTPGASAANFGAAVPVTVNGVEGDLRFDVTRNWNIGISASYAPGKIKNGLVACTDLNGDGVDDGLTTPPTLAALQDAVGTNNISGCRVTQRSSFQAPFSATVQSEFHQSISPKVDGFLRGLLSFNGQSQGDPAYRFDQVGAYGLLNLFAGIRYQVSAEPMGIVVLRQEYSYDLGGKARVCRQRPIISGWRSRLLPWLQRRLQPEAMHKSVRRHRVSSA